MEIKPGTLCPLLNTECVQFKCSWWMALRGTDRNTGKAVDDWGCAVAFLPMLLIENSAVQRETGAAVESFRNEVVKRSEPTWPPTPGQTQLLLSH